MKGRLCKSKCGREKWNIFIMFMLSARKLSVQSCTFHAIIMQWLTYALHHTLTEIRREGTGWVGGGIITFGTTYIMSLYHHHIIMQSSYNHHAMTNLRTSSYVDRDRQVVLPAIPARPTHVHKCNLFHVLWGGVCKCHDFFSGIYFLCGYGTT